ncbi:unnamed protein product, partial [marine sediment metagenome]
YASKTAESAGTTKATDLYVFEPPDSAIKWSIFPYSHYLCYVFYGLPDWTFLSILDSITNAALTALNIFKFIFSDIDVYAFEDSDAEMTYDELVDAYSEIGTDLLTDPTALGEFLINVVELLAELPIQEEVLNTGVTVRDAQIRQVQGLCYFTQYGEGNPGTFSSPLPSLPRTTPLRIREGINRDAIVQVVHVAGVAFAAEKAVEIEYYSYEEMKEIKDFVLGYIDTVTGEVMDRTIETSGDDIDPEDITNQNQMISDLRNLA